jgi:hypothetical protein
MYFRAFAVMALAFEFGHCVGEGGWEPLVSYN